MKVCGLPLFAWLLSALLFGCGFARAADNPFPKVAEINLNDRLVVLGEAPLEFMAVWAVSFSPDSSRLAIEFGEPGDHSVVRPGVEPRPTPNRYLLVVSVANPQDNVYWIKLGKLGASLSSSSAAAFAQRPPISELRWAPEGDALWYANVLIRFPGGDACRIPGGLLGFVGPATGLITVARPAAEALPRRIGSGPGPPPILGIIDFQCQLLEKLTTDLPVMLAAVSSDTRFLTTADLKLDSAARGLGLSDMGDLTLARLEYSELASPADPLRAMAGHPPTDGLPLKQLPIKGRLKIHLPQHYLGNTVFLEDVVCSLLEQVPSGSRDVQLLCWDTATGKRIRESKVLWSRSVVPMSTGGERIAIGDDGRPPVNGERAVPRLHSIWDFKTGQVMAEWSPELGQTPGTELGAHVGFAVSPDGHLIAEGGSNLVRIYRLP